MKGGSELNGVDLIVILERIDCNHASSMEISLCIEEIYDADAGFLAAFRLNCF